MDDEDEMKNQCFGGEYMGEVSVIKMFFSQIFCKFLSFDKTFQHSIHSINNKS